MNNLESKNKELLLTIVTLIDGARQRIAATVNSELTLLYWNIGKQINDEVLKNGRADYGKNIIVELSQELSTQYGSGFNKRNLQSFIKFNSVYQDVEILHAVRAKLTWTHIREIIYIKDHIKREFYTQMCIHERWSVRTLQDRMNSMLFERTAISRKPEQTILNDLDLLKSDKKMSPELTFRDPYLLDFRVCLTRTARKI